jgi:predicted DNA-binding WGR domain protein
MQPNGTFVARRVSKWVVPGKAAGRRACVQRHGLRGAQCAGPRHGHHEIESILGDRFILCVGPMAMARERLSVMIDASALPPLQLLVLDRIAAADNMARYYVLSIEPTLFGDAALVREWGRIGHGGKRRLDLYTDDRQAAIALDLWLARKTKRGYRRRQEPCDRVPHRPPSQTAA